MTVKPRICCVHAVKDIADTITKMAMDVPDGEMTPFVHNVIIELEHKLRQIEIASKNKVY